MKTIKLIQKVLGYSEFIGSSEVEKRLRAEGKEITYDTLMRYLKIMSEMGLITRKAIAKPINNEQGVMGSNRIPWSYYYSLNID